MKINAYKVCECVNVVAVVGCWVSAFFPSNVTTLHSEIYSIFLTARSETKANER